MARESALAKLPRIAKLAIGAGLLVVVLVTYVVVFYGDVAASIKSERSREGQLRKELADARQAEFEYQKDLAELTEREQRQRELNKILPSSTEYPAFLSSIQTVANVTGISLAAWTPRDEVPEQFYARVPMMLELKGRFHQVARFFYNVGQLDRIINMENIHITDPTPVDDEITVKVNALATAFRLLSEQPAEDASSKRDKRSRARAKQKKKEKQPK